MISYSTCGDFCIFLIGKDKTGDENQQSEGVQEAAFSLTGPGFGPWPCVQCMASEMLFYAQFKNLQGLFILF